MTDSPDFLSQDPNQGQGVPRLNRIPLLIAGVLLLFIFGAITYTYQMRLASLREGEARHTAEPAAATPSEVFKEAPDGGLIQARRGETAPPPPVKTKPEKRALTPPGPDPEALARERERRARERLEAARVAAALQALKAPTTVRDVTSGATRQGARSRAATSPSADGHLKASYAAAMRRRALWGEKGGEEDVNRAAEKAAWLKDRQPEKAGKHYLPEGRVGPKSPYELKAGTVIPAIMVGGINSDLPGQILAQVRENVYDTATGRHILIPQGAKLIGTYDNAITTGQERVLVAWTRIIYPDSSSIDLGKMPGADSAGLAGLKDRVDTHFWKTFGNALLMSVITAGVQISQGGGGGTNGMNAQQSIAAGLGQQLGQLGMEMARRGVRVQPTIKIRPGLRFTVVATKDAVIRPWRPRRASNGK
jgi:type IV secretion system protein VirB10